MPTASIDLNSKPSQDINLDRACTTQRAERKEVCKFPFSNDTQSVQMINYSLDNPHLK